MNGYFFYIEFPDKKSKRKATRKNLVGHSGTVIATFGKWYMRGKYWFKDCICDGSSTSSVQDEYLRDVCLLIGEKQAREIYPILFQYLDENRNV